MKRFVAGLVMVCLMLMGFAMAEMPSGQKALYEGLEEIELFTGFYECGRDFKPGAYILRLKGKFCSVTMWPDLATFKEWGGTVEKHRHCTSFTTIEHDDERLRMLIEEGEVVEIYLNSEAKLFMQPEQK